MGSGRRLSDQLDVIKSIANCTGTVHVLLGTYGLLAFRNLSAQLSRRSVDIHFPRYRADDPEDLKAFMTVLRSFEQHLPLSRAARLGERVGVSVRAEHRVRGGAQRVADAGTHWGAQDETPTF